MRQDHLDDKDIFKIMKHKVLVVGSDIVWNICNIWLHSIIAFLLNLCVDGIVLDE